MNHSLKNLSEKSKETLPERIQILIKMLKPIMENPVVENIARALTIVKNAAVID